jgi:hypothetical protein
MKHLMTLIALMVAVTAGAQTGLVEFPYNPDSNGDDMIGTADLLELLSLFGNEFSEEDLYLNDDSTTAIYYAGNMIFSDCFRNCSQLPSNWKIPSAEQIMQFDLGTLNNGFSWLDEPMSYHNSISSTDYYVISEIGAIMWASYNENQNCYCYTHERPKVEYSFCEGSTFSSITTCIEAKLAAGWYPMENFPSNRDRQGYAAGGASPTITSYLPQSHASFWRWAD